MLVRLIVTFKSALADKEILIDINHVEYALRILKAKAREIVNYGLYYKEDVNNYFVSPRDIYCVSWKDYEAS